MGTFVIFVSFVNFYVAGRCQAPSQRVVVFCPHAGPGTTRVQDPVLDFYPSARACARPPETVQSRSRTPVRRYPLRGGRPLGAPLHEPYAPRA